MPMENDGCSVRERLVCRANPQLSMIHNDGFRFQLDVQLISKAQDSLDHPDANVDTWDIEHNVSAVWNVENSCAVDVGLAVWSRRTAPRRGLRPTLWGRCSVFVQATTCGVDLFTFCCRSEHPVGSQRSKRPSILAEGRAGHHHVNIGNFWGLLMILQVVIVLDIISRSFFERRKMGNVSRNAR